MKLHFLINSIIISLYRVDVVRNAAPQEWEGEIEKIPTPALLFFRTSRRGYSVPINADRSLISFNHNTTKLYAVCPLNEKDEISEAMEVNFQYAFWYYCEEDYKPLVNTYRNLCYGGQNKAMIFSYKIGMKAKNGDTVGREFLIFALCVEPESEDVLFANYKVIPHFREETKIAKPNISPPRSPKKSRRLWSKLNFLSKKNEDWDDEIILRKLVPNSNISPVYSKGATNHRLNLKPQWLSLTEQWDFANQFIKIRAYKFNWSIYAGTYETFLSDGGNPVKFKIDEDDFTWIIPHIWWIMVIEEDKPEEDRKGIIIAMSNIPRRIWSSSPRNKKGQGENMTKLCDDDVCNIAHWSGIRDETKVESSLIYCCEISGDLSKKLTGQYRDNFKLGLLKLEKDEKEDTEKITNAPIDVIRLLNADVDEEITTSTSTTPNSSTLGSPISVDGVSNLV